MKAFLIFILFFVVFVLFVSKFLGDVDLTPAVAENALAAAPTQPVIAQAAAPTQPVIAQAAEPTQPVAMTVQNNTIPLAPTPIFVPVTGGCANPYTVVAGDWLTKIAAKCGTSLAALLQANPQITNPDLIYPDQLISMSGTAFVPVTGGCTSPYNTLPGDWLIKIAAKCGTTLADILQANPQITDPNLIYPDQQIVISNAAASIPAPIVVSGTVPIILPGTEYQVQANNLLPNTPVTVTIGPKDMGYTGVKSSTTDANGSLTTHITVPAGQDPLTPWVVIVTTISDPPISVSSQPFFIQ